jgi:hypothetical protein
LILTRTCILLRSAIRTRAAPCANPAVAEATSSPLFQILADDFPADRRDYPGLCQLNGLLGKLVLDLGHVPTRPLDIPQAQLRLRRICRSVAS